MKTLYLGKEIINADENNIGGRGAKLLQKTSLLLMLKKLVPNNFENNWGKCHLGNEGLKYPSKVQWKNLEILHVRNMLIILERNEISLDGIFSIADYGRWIKLSELSTNKVV